MLDSPVLILLLFGGAVWLLKIWWEDTIRWKSGKPNERAIPGATSVPAMALWIGSVGAVLLVCMETVGELAMGISGEQTNVTVLMLLALMGAGIIEEVVFRGYLVVVNRGMPLLLLSVVGFSLLFAIAHYQYYLDIDRTGEGLDIAVRINSKSTWSLLLLFLNSLWFYTVRFFRWNPNHSLLPCFVAHVSSNVAVFLVKAMQGHVTGLY